MMKQLTLAAAQIAYRGDQVKENLLVERRGSSACTFSKTRKQKASELLEKSL